MFVYQHKHNNNIRMSARKAEALDQYFYTVSASWWKIADLEDNLESVIAKGFEAPLEVFSEAAEKAAIAIGAMTKDQFIPEFADTYVKSAGKFNRKKLEGLGVPASQIAEMVSLCAVEGSKKHEEAFKAACRGGESVTVESLKAALMLYYNYNREGGNAFFEAGAVWPLHEALGQVFS